MDNVTRLRDETNIGDYVVFNITENEGSPYAEEILVHGEVTNKYPYCFIVDGKFYKWTDYLLGRVF